MAFSLPSLRLTDRCDREGKALAKVRLMAAITLAVTSQGEEKVNPELDESSQDQQLPLIVCIKPLFDVSRLLSTTQDT